MPKMDNILYGENISTLDLKTNEDNNSDDGDAIFFTLNSMMEIINAGEMCLFSQRSDPCLK